VELRFTVSLLISIGTLFEFVNALNDGVSLEKARTIAVTTMVFFQFFQAWNSRSESESIFRINVLSNPFLAYSMIAAFVAQVAFVYLPALQWVFRTEPIRVMDWVEIAAMTLTVIALVEIDKGFRRRGRSG
jgi:magnesium-transporting ATPase (P-type)